MSVAATIKTAVAAMDVGKFAGKFLTALLKRWHTRTDDVTIAEYQRRVYVEECVRKGVSVDLRIACGAGVLPDKASTRSPQPLHDALDASENSGAPSGGRIAGDNKQSNAED